MKNRLRGNGKSSRAIVLALLAAGCLSLLGARPRPVQEQPGPAIEPFYLRLLKSGENSYLAGNFREAIKDLKIAVFGLYPDRTLLARGQAYLGLGLAKIGEKEAGRESIEKALGNVGGPEKFESLGLQGTAQNDLVALLRQWKMSTSPASGAPPAAPKVQEPVRKTDVVPEAKLSTGKTAADYAAAAAPNRMGELEEAVRLNPRDAAAYFELADLQLKSGKSAAAKTTLTNLLKESPAEIEAHLALGRILYGEKSYKEADARLEKFLDLARATGLGGGKAAEARALRLLSAYHRDDSRKLRNLLPGYRDSFGAETIDSLPLFPEDKVILRTILQGGT